MLLEGWKGGQPFRRWTIRDWGTVGNPGRKCSVFWVTDPLNRVTEGHWPVLVLKWSYQQRAYSNLRT